MKSYNKYYSELLVILDIFLYLIPKTIIKVPKLKILTKLFINPVLIFWEIQYKINNKTIIIK